MQNMQEIRYRLHAIEQTRQITNAMHLLSSARMKREATRVDYNRLYFNKVRAAVKDILEKSKDVDHPYLKKRPGNRAAFLVVAGDKGLCGSYNSSVLKFALTQMEGHDEYYLETVGRIATDFFQHRGITPDIELLGVAQNPSLFNARRIMEDLFTLYDEDLMDELYIVHTRFINSRVQYPRCVRLLPLSITDYGDVVADYTYANDMMIYEPSPTEVFNRLVPQYAIGLIFGALVQSFASEQCARMNAMQTATKNADDMIAKLSLEYNRARQFAITNEIVEIVAGSQTQAQPQTQTVLGGIQ